MIRTPFDNLLASGTETGDAYTEPLVHVPLAGEFPEETTRRVVSNQLRKARDLASYGVPAYADKFGDPQAVTDETGAPLTGFSKKTNTAFDSLGVPRSLIRQPGGAAPVLGDAYEGAEIKTDQKTGAQFKVKPGLPKWRVGTDETVVKRNELAARDKELSKTAAIVGERLSLDQGAYVIGEHQQKAQKRELAGLLKEDFQGQAKIPDGTPFLDVRAQVAKFYDTALADKSASAKEFFSSNYTASAKANRDRLEARKAQALGHVDAMEQRAGMLAQQAELIAPAKEQKRQLAEQRIELHLQEMEARGLDTTPIRAQIARAAEVRAAAEQKAAAPQQPVAPQAAAAPEQGGNFLTDTGVSLGIGINSVLKMAGDLYGLATGNMDNPASKLGKENIEWYEGKKSGALQKVEKERRAAMDALPEDDETGRAWEWVKATFSSPRMITAMLAEQAPNLVPALGAGKLAGTGAAKILLKNASDDAAKAIALKTAGKIGVSAAVGTGAVMQGSDVGGDQYTELVALLHDMPPEQAAAIPEIADLLQRGATLDHAKLAFALTQARTTGALAGGVSIGSQLLPGARILERAAVGLGGKKLAGNIVVRAGKGFLGEGVQEMVEEGVGLGGKNVLAQPVDPTRRWDKGMGETLAMAGATGGILGAVGGAAGRGAADDGTDGTATPPPSGPAAPGAPGTPPTPDSPLNSDAIEQLVGIGIPRDKASQMTMEEAMDAVAAADEKLKAGQGTDIAPAADLAALDDATLDDKTRRMGLIVNQAAVDNSPQAPMLQAALDAMRAEKARREAAKPPAAPVIEQPETQGDAASVVAHTDDNAGSTPAPATLPAAPVDLAGLESSIKGNSDAALTSQPLNENTQTQGVPALPEAAPVQLPAAAKAVEPSSQAEVEPPPVTGQGPAPVAALKGAPATPAPAPAIPEDGMSSAEKGITYTPEDLTNVRFETGTVVRIKLDDGQEIEGEVEYAGTQPFFRGKKGEILALGNGMPDRDTIQSVSVVRSAVESLKAKDARKYGAPELPPPASRDDYERSLYTLSRRIHEENAKENFDGSRRSMQLQAQFDRMADEIELARTKRNYVRGNWRTYFKGGPMPRPIDYMDGPVDAKAQEPPKPSDFDPNREERKKRHDKPIEALPKLAEVRASLADAKQQLAKKSLAPERRAQMERIVAKREKELRDGLYVEAREQKADALPTAAPPTSPAPAKAAPAAKPSANQADADKLRDLEKVRYKTATQEKEIELLKARIKADPSKWSIGDGVAYRVNSGGKGVQLNRGFRITEINAAEKLARIVQVADTGLTSSGGDNDRIAAQWIHVAELVREKKYDKPPAKAAPAAEQPVPAPVAEPTKGRAEVPSFAAKFDKDTFLQRPAWVEPGLALDKVLGELREKNDPYHSIDVQGVWKSLTPSQRQDLAARGWITTNDRNPNVVGLHLSQDAVSARKYFGAQNRIAAKKLNESPTPSSPAPAAAPAPDIGAKQIGDKLQERLDEFEHAYRERPEMLRALAEDAVQEEIRSNDAWGDWYTDKTKTMDSVDAAEMASEAQKKATDEVLSEFQRRLDAKQKAEQDAANERQKQWDETRIKREQEEADSKARQKSEADYAEASRILKQWGVSRNSVSEQLAALESARDDATNKREKSSISGKEYWPEKSQKAAAHYQRQIDELRKKAEDYSKWTSIRDQRALDRVKLPAAPAPAEARAKEPWQMTRAEYVEQWDKSSGASQSRGETERLSDERTATASHKAVVVKALREGKPVPASVLADYPDLAPQPPSPSAQAVGSVDLGSVPMGVSGNHGLGESIFVTRDRDNDYRLVDVANNKVMRLERKSGILTLEQAKSILASKPQPAAVGAPSGIRTQEQTVHAGKTPQELLALAKPYAEYGPDYNRNIAESAAWLSQEVERNSKSVQISADELAVRLEKWAPQSPSPSAQAVKADAPLPPLLEVERKRGPLVAPYRAALERVEAKLADEDLDADAIERLERTRDKIEAKLLALESKAVPGAKKETAEERATAPKPQQGDTAAPAEPAAGEQDGKSAPAAVKPEAFIPPFQVDAPMRPPEKTVTHNTDMEGAKAALLAINAERDAASDEWGKLDTKLKEVRNKNRYSDDYDKRVANAEKRERAAYAKLDAISDREHEARDRIKALEDPDKWDAASPFNKWMWRVRQAFMKLRGTPAGTELRDKAMNAVDAEWERQIRAKGYSADDAKKMRWNLSTLNLGLLTDPLNPRDDIGRLADLAVDVKERDTLRDEATDAIKAMGLRNSYRFPPIPDGASREQIHSILEKAHEAKRQQDADDKREVANRQESVKQEAESIIASGGQLYWSRSNKETWRPVAGKPIVFKGLKWADSLFVFQRGVGSWTVSEAQSGTSLANGSTAGEAKATAEAGLLKMGEAGFKQAVARSMEGMPPKPDIASPPPSSAPSLSVSPQSISDVQPKHAIPAHIVSRIVDRLLARWPGAAPTTVIADGAQFPQAIRELAPPGLPLNRLGGAYHDGKVWINAAALGTAARVEQVFMHEQAGHHGVDGLLEGIAPGSRAKLAAQLQGHFPAQWAHVAGNYDAGLQVSETLARIQETFATNEATAKQASAWQRIVDWIRTTLTKAGFKAWSRADVEALLRRGIGRLRGEPGKSGGNAQFSIESEQRDKDYMAAVEAGDMETAQRMVESQRSESIRADVSNLLRLSGKQLMDSDVLASIRESKILDTIIAPVPVDVVNNLGGKQRATEMLLHYLTVPADSFRVGEPNDLVGLVSSAISADSARSAIAGIRAELSDANLRGLNSKMASALDAFQNRLTQLLIRSGTAVGGETFPATESTGAGSSGRGLNVKGGSANLTGLGHGVESTRSSGTSQGLQSISRITPAQDAMYLDAVKSGNTKLAQAMVDEAAKKAGYDVSDAWHGTRSSKPITEFRLSKEGSEEAVFFSDSKDEALQFPYPRGSTSAVRTFLRGDFLEVNAGRELYTPEEMEGWLRRAKKEGKEGVHVRDIQNFENGAISDTYAVFDPSQIKSAEPITRDTNGRVIPLSERFNPATPDIRFSIENESQQQGEQNENTADKTKTRPERDSRDEGIAQENEIFPGYEKLDGKQREAARIVQAVSRESRSPIMWVNMDEGKSGLAVTDDAIINVDPVRLAESAKDVEAVGGDPRAWIRSAFQEEEWHNRQLLLARGGFEETYARLFDLLENAHGTGFVAMLRVIYNAVGKPQFAAEFERMILQHRASQKITESHYGDISKLLPFIEAQQPEDFERHIAAVERTNPGIMEGSIYPLPPLRAETPIRHGIKNAMTEADRIFYDLLPRAEIKRRSLESIVAQAKALVENSPEEAERIFEGVEDGSAPVTDINEMVVLQLLARTKTAMNRVQATINDGKGKADGLDALMKQRGELKDRLQRLVDTSAAAGREASSALNVRRAVVDEDYSYAGILATMQADNRGVPLTEAQEKIAEVMAPKLEAAAKERTAAQTEVDMQAVYDEVLADIEQRIKDAAEFEGTEKEMGERGKKAARAKKAGIDWFKPGAASFSLEGDASAAKSEKGDANAKAPPPIPKDAYKVVMEYAVSAIQSGSAAESAFNAEVEMEFGPKIKPYLADIFKTATKMKSLMAVKTKEGKTVRKPKVKETTADIAARIGKERDADPEASLDPTDIVGMVRANVEAGAGGGVTGEGKAVLAEAIRMTTEQLQEEGIELTEDEVRDAFTQYGQKTKLKKDSLSVKMREIRRIGQLVSAVRDAVQGKKEAEAALAAGEKPTSLTKPQLTGLEREKATQAVRDMDKARIAAIKELQEAASALGIDIGGAGSMASTLAAAKTRMTNAIEDVEREIRTKQRIQRSKKGVNYDAEATELKAKLDARRKERDEIFGPSELTDEQRLAAALAAAIRNEKEWNSKLVMAQLGIFEPTASTYRPVTSPELEEIKARTAAAREAVADLKAADSATQEAAKEKQLEARIAELEKQLASGIIAAPEKQQTAETQRVTELTARRDELKKAITARRKANQPVPDAEQKKLEALESQLARLIENKPKAEKAATVDTAEQAFARQQLEAARAELAEKRKNQPFDPDAWLAKTEKAIATRTAKLEERLASGDILPPVKAERPTSPALEAARHKYDKLIGELNRQRFKLELANRSRAGKFFGSIAEILQTSRAIITGGELSAVLRQGGFSTLGHPILGMQSAGEMLKSFVSERKAHTTQDEVNHWLQGSPMRGKLDITQHSGIRKHHMEEAYMSRWINENIPAWLRKIPVLGFGIETGRRFIAASARAYSTYLNVLRMKVAKNLLKTLPLNPAKPTQAEIQQIADFVNASTGRGKMPKRWQGGAVALNTLFFAPKNFISRVQLLIGQPLWHGTMRTRLIVAKEYARFLIGAATILALAKLGQDDDDPPIETDLRSSDFLKVRFGNTRLDIFSGLIQPLVFAGRTGTLETKTIAGKVKSLHGEAVKYGGDDWSDVAFRFGRTKFAPAPSATFDLLSGRNVVGQPASATDIGANMIIPMTFRDIAHAMEEQGATKGTILSMLAILGMGVNTFSDRKQTPPTGMNADAVVLKSRHELPVPSLSQKSKRPVFQGF